MIEKLTTEINELNGRLKASLANTMHLALELGNKLIESKAALPHGEFQHYIQANCSVGYRQAARYMKLAKSWPELTGKSDLPSLLGMGIEGSLALLAEPEQTKFEPGFMIDELPWLVLARVRIDQLNNNIQKMNAITVDLETCDTEELVHCFYDGMHFTNELKETLDLLDHDKANGLDLMAHQKGEALFRQEFEFFNCPEFDNIREEYKRRPYRRTIGGHWR